MTANPHVSRRGTVAAQRFTPTQLVQRSGTSLTLNGSPWRFVGYDCYRLTSSPGSYYCGSAMSDTEMATILDRVVAAGGTVVRTWFFQSYYQGSSNTWTGFDRLLSAASARGLKVIATLGNNYPDCEFAAKDDAFYSTGYKSPGYGYSLSFRDWCALVVTRYSRNTTIAFWQLMNEAATGGDCNTPNTLRAFADDMAGVVKAQDPNHLVSLGTIGSGQCGALGDDYRTVHAGLIDICEYHDYGSPNTAMPGDPTNGLQRRIDLATALGKPIIIGESGILAAIEGTVVSAATLTQRSTLFANKMSAAFTAGVRGYLIWDVITDDRSQLVGYGPNSYGVGAGDPTNAAMLTQAQAL